MTKSTKGFYTVEAAIFLPIVILAVLTLGYFIKADMAWEKSLHIVYDECTYSQAFACNKASTLMTGRRIKKRLNYYHKIEYDLRNIFLSYSNAEHTNLNTLSLRVRIHQALPLKFSHGFEYYARINYRDFVGLKYNRQVLGSEGLEAETESMPVWIFPQSGTKYHKESCTYVKATVYSCILSESVKKRFDPCNLCNSGSMSVGSLVFCFYGDDSCYHRGNCRSIKRHYIVIDKAEAEKKGYRPCSKCGG